MFSAFIEDPKGDNSSEHPLWKIILVGVVLIDGMALCFLPMGIYASVQETVLSLLLLFLPYLFLTLRLAIRYGNSIFLAFFLSILAASLSALYLGQFLGVLGGWNIAKEVSLSAAQKYHSYRLLTFKQGTLRTDFMGETGIAIQSQTGVRMNRSVRFRVVPYVSKDWNPKVPVRVWATCMEVPGKSCDWAYPKNLAGENLDFRKGKEYFLQAIEDATEKHNIQSVLDPLLIRPIRDPERKIFDAGIYGMGGVFFLNYLWVFGMILYDYLWKQKER